jgi:hypothetical protein
MVTAMNIYQRHLQSKLYDVMPGFHSALEPQCCSQCVHDNALQNSATIEHNWDRSHVLQRVDSEMRHL